jgi:hypothetical protein
MKNANHPIWAIIRMALILGTLIFVLWMNASHFDDTEIKTILTMFLALLGAEGISKAFAGTRT